MDTLASQRLLSQRPTYRIGHIDSIRGIAALLVVYMHTTSLFMWFPEVKAQGTFLADLAAVFDFGRIGVLTFFAISGFVICPSLKGDRRIGTRKFLISRFFRLYPAFWFSIILALLVMFVWRGRAIDLGQVLGNSFMLYSAFQVEPLQGLYWTLEVELVFYMLCLCLFLSGVLQKPAFLFLIGILLMAVQTLIFANPELATNISDTLSDHWKRMPWHLSIMFWGGLFRVWYENRDAAYRFFGLHVPVVALVVILAGLILLRPVLQVERAVENGAPLMKILEHMPYIFGIGLFVIGALYIKLNNPVMVWLGTISYSLYLLHPVAGRTLAWSIRKYFPQWADMHLSVYLIVSVALTILLAAIAYYFVEKPAIAYGRSLQRR